MARIQALFYAVLFGLCLNSAGFAAEKCDEYKFIVCTSEYDPHHCDANALSGGFLAGYFGTNKCRAIAQANYDLCVTRNLLPDEYTMECFEE